jgi:ABC-type phosphate transport system substrate-binding protein
VGRYALLPIANAGNSALDELNRKSLNSRRLKDLFFEKDIFDDEVSIKPSKLEKEYRITIYSGNGTNSTTLAFASHFGHRPSEVKGKKILGDDAYLINSVQKDSTGITVNALSYIYDIETRHLKSNLALVPLDLKKKQKEVFAELDIDKAIELLEEESIEVIPVEEVGFAYQRSNPEVKAFLKWVLSEGQAYNHTYGFLNLEKEPLALQVRQIDDQYFTLTNSK